MKVLCCHPSGLMYTEIFLRLEPLGVELVATAARAAGHKVRIMDLQFFRHQDYLQLGLGVGARWTDACGSRGPSLRSWQF